MDFREKRNKKEGSVLPKLLWLFYWATRHFKSKPIIKRTVTVALEQVSEHISPFLSSVLLVNLDDKDCFTLSMCNLICEPFGARSGIKYFQ